LFKKSGKNDTFTRGSSAKTAHVLWATQKSPHPVEARWLVFALLMYFKAYIPFLGKEKHFSCVDANSE